tara:strand:- start:6066 stop:6761 length:696 start_codon:yes stop_codon:yes gene_type:complete
MNKISFQNVYQTITQRGEFKLGQRASTPDGREWRFVTSTTLAAGHIAIPVATFAADLYSSSTDQQGRKVYLTRAADTNTVGVYEDAIGVVDDGVGVGQTFKIRTNNATTFTLYPETALGTALAVADSDLTVVGMANCKVAAVTVKIQMTQGGTQVAFTTGDYGWLLQRGDGRVLAGEGLTVGGSFVSGDDTAGQVLKGTTAKGEFDEQTLGYAIVANAAADQGALVRYNVA